MARAPKADPGDERLAEAGGAVGGHPALEWVPEAELSGIEYFYAASSKPSSSRSSCFRRRGSIYQGFVLVRR